MKLQSECMNCADKFAPNTDSVPLCGYCQKMVHTIKSRLSTMLAVTMTAIQEQLLRLSESDTARLDAIYNAKNNLPPIGTTSDELHAHRVACELFDNRMQHTIRKADELASVLVLQRNARTIQRKMASINLYEKII